MRAIVLGGCGAQGSVTTQDLVKRDVFDPNPARKNADKLADPTPRTDVKKPMPKPTPPAPDPQEAPGAVEEESDGAGFGFGAEGPALDEDFEFPVYIQQMLWAVSQNWYRPDVGGDRSCTVYFRIGRNGQLCEGSAKLPRQLDERHLHEIEACVFESNFAHVNHDATLKGATDNKAHVAFWRNKERLKEAVKVKELVCAGTLGEHFW